MSTLRFRAVEEAFKKKAIQVTPPDECTSAYYGKYVFNEEAMKSYLSAETLKILKNSVEHGETLDRSIADEVATAMKQWAMKLGATHYSHWFQPLTGGTAEKHDSFIEYKKEIGGDIIEKFTGKLLVQAEPDASSFPNGGIRSTFEARGYTAWDPSSPAFVIDDTLCIPTIFISYTGDALDYKAPLLKSIAAINKAATDVCATYFDSNVKNVKTYLGWEQEYFLVDEGLFATRPDLLMTGRTLLGHESPKNQQLEDHYFGSIPQRVVAFMRELEFEVYKYGIPLKTRHNEVAPNQFELAPIFNEVNLSVDQNLLVMSLMKRIARRHGFRVLLHEKPFNGVNGSGKHCNWSLGTNTGVGLFTPGKTPAENLQFITFIINALMAVANNDSLLKASISSATNAHRLGANEAPPAIISAFLGTQISYILNKLEKSTSEEAIVLDNSRTPSLRIAHIPEVLIDNTDRNRTSPFAFTGNRFEFRALGSSANCSSAMIVLNSIMAAQLIDFKKEVDVKIANGEMKEKAIFEVLKQYIKKSKKICFDGNGYSEEWKKEALSRGLNCETSVPKIFQAYKEKKTIDMFERLGVMTARELHARTEVEWNTYTKKIQIESRVLGDLAMNHIIPIAIRYQALLVDNVYKLKQTFSEEKANELSKNSVDLIEKIAFYTASIKKEVEAMTEARKSANTLINEADKANAYHNTVLPYFEKIRQATDSLELIVDNEMWTLPKYRELLFIR